MKQVSTQRKKRSSILRSINNDSPPPKRRKKTEPDEGTIAIAQRLKLAFLMFLPVAIGILLIIWVHHEIPVVITANVLTFVLLSFSFYVSYLCYIPFSNKHHNKRFSQFSQMIRKDHPNATIDQYIILYEKVYKDMNPRSFVFPLDFFERIFKTKRKVKVTMDAEIDEPMN